MSERAVLVELLKSGRVLHDDDLMPGVNAGRVQRNAWEGHGAVAIDAAEQKTMQVGADPKVHPVGREPEEALAVRAVLRLAAKSETLLAGTAGNATRRR